MIRYGLSKQDGRILFEPQEEQSSILLMTFDQFQKEKKYPHHLVLEKASVQHVTVRWKFLPSVCREQYVFPKSRKKEKKN